MPNEYVHSFSFLEQIETTIPSCGIKSIIIYNDVAKTDRALYTGTSGVECYDCQDYM